jgi:hypothetical protein
MCYDARTMKHSIIRPRPPRIDPMVRLMALTSTNQHTGCWEWLGAKSADGYGQFVLDGRRGRKKVRVPPYRYTWEVYNGRAFPKGKEPDHTCNNRSCVNPRHIEPVTHSENQKRAYVRGRKRPGRDYVIRPRPTHCPRGHEYTEANKLPGGKAKALQCRACGNLQNKRRQLAKNGVIVTIDQLHAESTTY